MSKRTFDITFIRERDRGDTMNGYLDDLHRTDETEFDIEDGEFPAMFMELYELFQDFVDENGYKGVSIYDVGEVPYDGEEE